MKYLSLFFVMFLVACGKDVSPTTQIITEKVPTNVEVIKTVEIERENVQCDVYDLVSLSSSSLPNFDTLPQLKVGSLGVGRILNYSTNDTTTFSMFEGTSHSELKTRFGLVCTAKVNAPLTGSYAFRVTSDDGMRLYVSGVKVLEYNGLRAIATSSANVNLVAGTHTIRLEYHNNFGDKGLILSWRVPGGVDTVIDDQDFVK
jgi:hypothetical protein